MSDYIDSIFDGVSILINKKLEDVSYDTTIICTIINDSESKNGVYRVTDGSMSYIAYSDKDNYREGEQVRVNIPMGDYTQKKFIVGKYAEDEGASPITYVSPLESVVNITGNLLTPILGEREYGILANGPETKKILWNQKLAANEFRDLKPDGIYNTLIVKADFKTFLYNQNYTTGTYGLQIDLLVRPSEDSTVKMQRTVTLSSEEMFGNPYNFAIYSPQAKTFTIAAAGIIEGIELSLYQNGDFTNSKQEYIKPPIGMADNIIVKNIQLGFGSNLLDVEDNVVKIYSENGTTYKYNPNSDDTNRKKIGLVWYNKDEDNRYVGFSDGVYGSVINEVTNAFGQVEEVAEVYDEIKHYIKPSSTELRLTSQKGRLDIPEDEVSLRLAANIEEASSILYKISSMLTQDLGRELNYFLDLSKGWDTLESKIESLSEQLMNASAAMRDDVQNSGKLIKTLENNYKLALKYLYDNLHNEEEQSIDIPTLSSFDPLSNIIKAISNNQEYEKNKWLEWLIDEVQGISTIQTGYKEVYNNYLSRVRRAIDKVYEVINTLPNMTEDYNTLKSYVTANGLKEKMDNYSPYAETDFSNIANKYCIYWYHYEPNYTAPADEYTLMPKGWRRLTLDDEALKHPITKNPYNGLPSKKMDNGQPVLNKDGKEIFDIQLLDDSGFIYPYLNPESKEEKFVAIVCYNHAIYQSNELIFTNEQADLIPDKKTLDKSDSIRFEHLANSQESYLVYNDNFYLRDMADEYKVREIRCHYDGLLHQEDALAKSNVYWYIPTDSTMLNYDKDFLASKGFDTDDGQVMHYSKPGYICFYKQIVNVKSSIDPDVDKQMKSYEFNVLYGEEDYDDRSFWYSIKSYYEPSATQNHIICRVIPNGDIDKVENGEYFTFGIAGTNGTKFTLAITNRTSQCAIDYGTQDPLKLNVVLKDANNAAVPFEDGDPEVSWYMHTITGPAFDIQDNVISISSHNGCGILKATAEVNVATNEEEPEDDEVDTSMVKKIHLVNLEYLYAVPWSSGPYYISGPTYIAYNNLGTLDSLSMFDSSYKIFSNITKQELNNIQWSIVYYKKVGDAWSRQELDTVEKSYMPVLNNANGLTPSTLYIQGLDIIPIVIASQNGQDIWYQPILITQNRYPSPLLNDWDGAFKMDADSGVILSTMLGAGQKNKNRNTFDGVLMGDVADAAQINSEIGLYGFNDGAQSFGLKIDGTAFFGKSGRGRIEIDGNRGIIGSASYIQNKDAVNENLNTAGMLIDLDDGLIDILGATEISVEGFNRLDGNSKKGCSTYADYKSRYGVLYVPAVQASQSHIRISAISPYFNITSKDDVNLIYISNDDYYLQSNDYVAGTYSDVDGVTVDNDGYLIKKLTETTNKYVNVSGADTSEKVLGVGTGVYFNLQDGKLDAYNLKITSKNIFFNSAKNANPYFVIKSNKGNNLFYVGSSAFYLKTDNYQEANGTNPATGFKFNLQNGLIQAHNFSIEAGLKNSTNYLGIFSSNQSEKLTINKTEATNWRLIVGNKFGVTSDGAVIAASGNIGGWRLTPGYLDSYTLIDPEGQGVVGNYKTRFYIASDSDSASNYICASAVYKKPGATEAKFDTVFCVTKNGILHANGAVISGDITATSGTIGGCTIKDGVLQIKNANISGTITAGKIDVGGLQISGGQITSGTINATRIPNLSADKITSGTIDASKVTVTNIDASKITTGTISANRINGGTISGCSINIDSKFQVNSKGVVYFNTNSVKVYSNKNVGKYGVGWHDGITAEMNFMYNGVDQKILVIVNGLIVGWIDNQ